MQRTTIGQVWRCLAQYAKAAGFRVIVTAGERVRFADALRGFEGVLASEGRGLTLYHLGGKHYSVLLMDSDTHSRITLFRDARSMRELANMLDAAHHGAEAALRNHGARS